MLRLSAHPVVSTWSRRILLRVFTLLPWVVLLMFPMQAGSQVFDVCANGCRYSSIQAAINAATVGRTITVGPGTYRELLRLKAGVSIVGAGPGQTIVQGANTAPMITIVGSQIQRNTVLEGMTITGGGGTGPGGLYIASGAAPTLRNLLISSNIVTQGPAGGGLMSTGNAHPLLDRVEFLGNRASAGSAITLWGGRATLRNCTIANNVSEGPMGSVYGAVYLDEGSELTMENSVISGTSSSSGGAMAVVGHSKATIIGSRLQGNQARTQGGAIFVRAGSTLILDRVVLIGNSSLLDGGAVTVSEAMASIGQSTFVSNSARQDAGALNVILNSELTLRDTIVENNRVERFAGGITIQSGSQALVERNVFRNNIVTANDPNPLAGVGGAIKVYGPATNATIRFNRVEGNTARDGAGIYVEDQASAEIFANEIVGNRATQYGGGIVINDSASAQIIANIVVGNRSSSDGGGVWVHNDSTASVQGNLIAANRAMGSGGGLTVFGDTRTDVLDNLIIGNVSGAQGGGVRLVTASTRLANNRIRDNYAAGDGGGVLISSGTSAATEMKSNLIEGNRAGGVGDGVFVVSANSVFASNLIVANGRGQAGDGIHLATGANLSLSNNVILRNDYGIRSSGGTLASSVRNNVFDNRLGNYSGVAPGVTDLSVDPLYVDGYYLSHIGAGQSQNSPLIDAGQGTALSQGLGTMTTRTDGVPDQGPVDIGVHFPTPLRPAPDQSNVYLPLLQLSG